MQPIMSGHGKFWGKQSRVRTDFDMRGVGISDRVISRIIFEQGSKWREDANHGKILGGKCSRQMEEQMWKLWSRNKLNVLEQGQQDHGEYRVVNHIVPGQEVSGAILGSFLYRSVVTWFIILKDDAYSLCGDRVKEGENGGKEAKLGSYCISPGWECGCRGLRGYRWRWWEAVRFGMYFKNRPQKPCWLVWEEQTESGMP